MNTGPGWTDGERRWLMQGMAWAGLRHWLYGRAAGDAARAWLLGEWDRRRAGRWLTPEVQCLEAALELSLREPSLSESTPSGAENR